MDIIDKFIDDVNISLYGKSFDDELKMIPSYINNEDESLEDALLNRNIQYLVDLINIGGVCSNPDLFKQYSSKIALYLYKYQRVEDARKYIKNKNIQYMNELLCIFESIYDKLTIEEEAYILDHINDYNLGKYYYIPFRAEMYKMLHQEHILHYRIHDKTGKKYFKILKKMKETYKAYHIYRYDEFDDVNISLEISDIKRKIKCKK